MTDIGFLSPTIEMATPSIASPTHCAWRDVSSRIACRFPRFRCNPKRRMGVGEAEVPHLLQGVEGLLVSLFVEVLLNKLENLLVIHPCFFLQEEGRK